MTERAGSSAMGERGSPGLFNDLAGGLPNAPELGCGTGTGLAVGAPWYALPLEDCEYCPSGLRMAAEVGVLLDDDDVVDVDAHALFEGEYGSFTGGESCDWWNERV